METSQADFVTLSAANVDSHHLCCAIMGGRLEEGVELKRSFLARGFRTGLVFRKLDVRGKVFIEYAPAEASWRPVEAPGFLVIHCLWVSGRYKGRGLGAELLEHCIDAVGSRYGVVAVAGRKPYLTDTRFYLSQGFELIESTETGFDLVCFGRSTEDPVPRFAERAQRGRVDEEGGVHFEYAYQCPFVPQCLREMSSVARVQGLVVSSRQLKSATDAHGAASPFGTFGAFLFGRLITHELMSEAKFRKLLTKELGRRS